MKALSTAMPIVHLHQGNITTTSLNVAKVFEKPHKNIIRDIRNLEIPEEFSRLNFEPTLYLDSCNREQKS